VRDVDVCGYVGGELVGCLTYGEGGQILGLKEHVVANVFIMCV